MFFKIRKKHERDLKSFYTIAIGFSVSFMIFGIAFILYAGKWSKEDTVEEILQSTQQTEFAIDTHIKEVFITLSSAADFLEKFDLQMSDTWLINFSEILSSHDVFVSVGAVSSKGQAVWVDWNGSRHTADFSGEQFINQAFEGRQVITEGRWDNDNKIRVNYYAVPIYRNNMVKGVLFAAAPEDNLRAIIDHSLYAGMGFAHIITSEGKFVLRSHSPLRVTDETGVFGVQPPVEEEVKQRMLQNMAERKIGFAEKDVYGKNRLAAYAPLKVNGWYIFYAVPENQVNAGLRAIKNAAVGIIGIASAVFILFIFLIRNSNNKIQKGLEQLAFEDSLTGGKNYQKFLLDANATLLKRKPGKLYSLWYYNIKDFKYVNDIFGREVGDRLLQHWAQLMAEGLRPGELFGRVGGDIFVALRTCTGKEDIAERFACEASLINAYPATANYGYKVAVRLGVYLVDEADCTFSVVDMLDRANEAQKSVKREDGCQFRFYSKEMRDQKLWETEIEARFEAALANEEFEVYLQPKVAIQNVCHIMGMEALVRWTAPDKGLLSPARFIPLFEKNGMIVRLDRYIFETACKSYRENMLEGKYPPLVMSVNVSRLGLLQRDFLETYVAIKEKYEIPDKHIELEFTESLVFEDHLLFQSIVAECQKHGFLCSLDDFGAGYSSLHILKSLKVDVLKLDRLFFEHGEDCDRGQKLIKNIITMAKSLGMKTVAEGIELDCQVEQLREVGCDAIQGYIFAKPMPIKEFKYFVETWPEIYNNDVVSCPMPLARG